MALLCECMSIVTILVTWQLVDPELVLLYFLNGAPIYWFSKRQGGVKRARSVANSVL